MRKLILGLLCLSLTPVFADSFSGMLDGSESPYKAIESTNSKCLHYKKSITVVTQKDEDAPGDHVLIKSGDDASCSWDNAAGWETDSGEASYFLGKWKNLIFIDRGTGPDGRDVPGAVSEDDDGKTHSNAIVGIDLGDNSLDFLRRHCFSLLYNHLGWKVRRTA